jgi:Na+-driven multidrug efflux pump
LAAAALAAGSGANILLDYLFIAEFGWGLAGAALATGLSQIISTLVLVIYFFMPSRTLYFNVKQNNWREVLQAAYNGVSEFVNEISGGIIALLFNWMLIQRAGVEGVAAITVVNYLLMLGFMTFFAISDSIQVVASQNFGARNHQRIQAFLRVAIITIGLFSLFFIITLITAGETLIYLFVDDSNTGEMVALANEFILYILPLFIFVGFNMLVSGYLTAIHFPFQSSVVALCRSLIFPASLLVLCYFLLDDYLFVAALSVAEVFSFILALVIFLRYSPAKILA